MNELLNEVLNRVTLAGNDAIEKIKKSEKEKTLSEDESHRLQDEIQKLTDKFNESLDKHEKAKEKDILG